MIKISVIIPTHNRPNLLIKCLRALARQSFPCNRFEVFVCDDGSGRDTEETVSNLSVPYTLHYLRQEKKGPAAARNMGIEKASGDTLLFINDDTIADSNMLFEHFNAHERVNTGKIAVLGNFSLLPENSRTPFGYVIKHTNALFGFSRLKAGSLYEYDHFYTCNISIPHKAAADAGPFDEDFGEPAAEDIEMGYRLHKKGYRVLYAPECLSWHDHSISPKDFCLINKIRGYWAVLFFLKHPDLDKTPCLNHKTIQDWKKKITREYDNAQNIVEELQKNQPCNRNHNIKILQKKAAEILADVEYLHQFYYKLGILKSPFLEKLLEEQLHRSPESFSYDQETKRSLMLFP